MVQIKGIDVSKWNGDVDFAKVKADGIKFVMLRAGLGRSASQKDTYFERNYAKAKAAGLDVGVYWYSYAVSGADAKLEARACLECIGGKRFEYPIYFDLEEPKQLAKGKRFCSNLVKVFCGEIEKVGYFAGLYMSRKPLQTLISDDVKKRYALWVAEYNSKCNYKEDHGMWQYTAKGSINGHNGQFDMNYCYVDYPEIIRKNGLNGYKTAEQLALEILDGKWGNGDERKNKLTAAGYDYSEVQKKVNEILKSKSAVTKKSKA